MRFSYIVAGAFLIFLFLNQCSDPRTGDNESVRLARVGSSYLTLDDARADIPSFMLAQDSIQSLHNYRERWVREQLLLLEAQNLQLLQKKSIQNRITNARKEILTNALKEVILEDFSKKVALSNQEIKNYFESHKEQFTLPERYVQFQHLETPELSTARTALRELEDNGPWPAIARKYSRNAKEKIENAQQFWPVSIVLNDVETMKRYVATLDSGAVSPIQREDGMYHFVNITGVKEAGTYADPEWFAEKLSQWLLVEKQRKHYDSYIKNLYLKAKEDNEIDLYNVFSPDIVNPDSTEINKSNE